jgi:hypothetical protein
VPYYGDPEAVLQLCRSVESLKSEPEKQIAAFDIVARAEIASSLEPLYVALPDEDSTMTTSPTLALMWTYKMCELIYAAKYATQRSPSAGGKDENVWAKRYERVLADVRKNVRLITGASTSGILPEERAASEVRMEIQQTGLAPRSFMDLLPRALRPSQPGKDK